MTKVLKILLMGSEKSGKTTAVFRHCRVDGGHNHSYVATIGVDFRVKNIQLSDGKTYRSQIWDTAGRPSFRSICYAYLKGSNGIFLFYDVSNRESFANITTILSDVYEFVGNKDVPLMLVGTSVEREDREISYCEGASLAQTINKPHGIPFYEISSKLNYRVDDAFVHMYEMAANLTPCQFNGAPVPWTTELHTLCTKDQKVIFKTILLFLSQSKHKLPNDIILCIFNFVPVAKREIEWYTPVQCQLHAEDLNKKVESEKAIKNGKYKCICF